MDAGSAPDGTEQGGPEAGGGRCWGDVEVAGGGWGLGLWVGGEGEPAC